MLRGGYRLDVIIRRNTLLHFHLGARSQPSSVLQQRPWQPVFIVPWKDPPALIKNRKYPLRWPLFEQVSVLMEVGGAAEEGSGRPFALYLPACVCVCVCMNWKAPKNSLNGLKAAPCRVPGQHLGYVFFQFAFSFIMKPWLSWAYCILGWFVWKQQVPPAAGAAGGERSEQTPLGSPFFFHGKVPQLMLQKDKEEQVPSYSFAEGR